MSSSYCEKCKKETEDKRKPTSLKTYNEHVVCAECNAYKSEATDKLWEEEDKQKQQKIIDCKAKGIPCCPECASTSVQPVAKGFSLLTGFIGSGKTLNYCLNCGNKWKP